MQQWTSTSGTLTGALPCCDSAACASSSGDGSSPTTPSIAGEEQGGHAQWGETAPGGGRRGRDTSRDKEEKRCTDWPVGKTGSDREGDDGHVGKCGSLDETCQTKACVEWLLFKVFSTHKTSAKPPPRAGVIELRYYGIVWSHYCSAISPSHAVPRRLHTAAAPGIGRPVVVCIDPSSVGSSAQTHHLFNSRHARGL